MSLQPQLKIGLTCAYDPWDQIFFPVPRNKIASVLDVSIICANALQRALLQGRLWSVWVLGQFSQTRVYKGVQQPFWKAFFIYIYNCVLGDKRPNVIFKSQLEPFAYAQCWSDSVFTQWRIFQLHLNPPLPVFDHFEHHKGAKEVNLLSKNYSNTLKTLCRPRERGGEASPSVWLAAGIKERTESARQRPSGRDKPAICKTRTVEVYTARCLDRENENTFVFLPAHTWVLAQPDG